MLMFLAVFAGLAAAWPDNSCAHDHSTNCWSATNGGQQSLCTNSASCPTCGDYMAVECRYTCRQYIDECSAPPPNPVAFPTPFPTPMPVQQECYSVGGKYDVPVLESVSGTNNMDKCQKKCSKKNKCNHVNYKHSSKTCELLQSIDASDYEPASGWVTASVDCDVPEGARAELFALPSSPTALIVAGVSLAAVATAVGATLYGRKHETVNEPLIAQVA